VGGQFKTFALAFFFVAGDSMDSSRADGWHFQERRQEITILAGQWRPTV